MPTVNTLLHSLRKFTLSESLPTILIFFHNIIAHCSLCAKCYSIVCIHCNGVNFVGMIQDIKTSSNITVNFGETVTLTCEAKGYPPPFITWLRGLKPLYHNVRYTLTSYYGYGMLRISEVHMSDAGLYSCVVVSGLYGSTVVQPAISVIVNDGE